MNRSNFTVIKGGSQISNHQDRRFISAYVTDTRLMGVVGLHLHWELLAEGMSLNLHQFFYFDAEEYGIDDYKSYVGDDSAEVLSIEESMFGSLGGRKNSLTQREAKYLIQDFCRDSQLLGVPLPEPKSEYEFLLREPVTADSVLLNAIAEKMCVKLQSDYELVHYFLMRSFGKDKKGLSYLCDLKSIDSGRVQDVSEPNCATLCRNMVEEFINADGSISYLSESLVEVDQVNQYRLIITEICTGNRQVTAARRLSSFTVSMQEVAMMLSRTEYVTVFEVLSPPEEAQRSLEQVLGAAVESMHENGKLFVLFHRNNEHVNRRVFRLNDDIQSLFFLTDFGQMIVAAYTLPAIWEAERRLQKSPLGMLLIPTAKFEFKEPVLFDFVQSDYEDFEDFLDAIKRDE